MPAAQGAPTALFRFYRCVTRAALPLAARAVRAAMTETLSTPDLAAELVARRDDVDLMEAK